MKKSLFAILALTASTLFLNGCSTQVKVRSIEPAEVDRAASLKRIAVLDFKADSPGLSGKIQTSLSQKRLEGQTFFTIVDRKNLDNTLKEQKLQYSGLVQEKQSVELGEMLGAQALISGEITSATHSDSHFYEKRYRCLDKACKQMQEYAVRCTSRTFHLGATVQMVDVQRGDIVTSQSMTQQDDAKHCQDDNQNLPNESQVLDQLANRMANNFTRKLTPNYVYRSLDLLDDPDIDYNSQQKKTLETSLEFIEANRLDKAETLLGQLFQSTGGKSYVAAYNLGAVYEALGQYDEAKTYYNIADQLQTKPVDEINAAVNRIDSVIQKREAALQQISR